MPPETIPLRHRWRAALRIEQQLRSRQRCQRSYFPPDVGWERFEQELCRWRAVDSRGWLTAARQQQRGLERAALALQEQIGQCLRGVEDSLARPVVATVAEIFRDLTALELEFERVELQLRERRLILETGPIVLEHWNLGSFEIRLHWDRLGYATPYEVVALAPNPAASESSTVHPHVRNQTLCEGDGQAAIARALAEGRLFEFCLLVRQILRPTTRTTPTSPLGSGTARSAGTAEVSLPPRTPRTANAVRRCSAGTAPRPATSAT